MRARVCAPLGKVATKTQGFYFPEVFWGVPLASAGGWYRSRRHIFERPKGCYFRSSPRPLKNPNHEKATKKFSLERLNFSCFCQARKRHINMNFFVRLVLGRPRVCPGISPGLSLSMPNMTRRPGHRTMEMNGGSSAPYLARTPCVPLFCTLFNRGGIYGLLDYRGRAGNMSIVRWNLRPVIFGGEKGCYFRSSQRPFKNPNLEKATKKFSLERLKSSCVWHEMFIPG